MYFVVRANTIVLYFNLLSEASASFWKKCYFLRPKQNFSGLKYIDPGVPFPFFFIETPSL